MLGELTSNPKSDDLFDKYSKFKRAYDDCEYRVNELADSIENIEDVSRNMFDEWTDQLAEYTNQDLRRASETQRADTQRSYDVLIAATKSAERAIKPVHATFHDQVLFLKGNVNAEAIVTLQGQTAAVDADVAKLVVDLDAAIAAAEKFLEGMPKR